MKLFSSNRAGITMTIWFLEVDMRLFERGLSGSLCEVKTSAETLDEVLRQLFEIGDVESIIQSRFTYNACRLWDVNVNRYDDKSLATFSLTFEGRN